MPQVCALHGYVLMASDPHLARDLAPLFAAGPPVGHH